jgi:hypothetical protein
MSMFHTTMHSGRKPLRVHLAILFLIAAGMTAGCATTAKEASKAAAQTTVQTTLNELNDPHTRQLLAEVMNTPELQAAARNLAANVTQGAVDGLTQEEQLARIQEFSQNYVVALSSALAQGLHHDLSREIASLAAVSTDAAFRAALSGPHRADMEALSAAVTRAASQAMATGIREDIGPALREVLARDVGPGLGSMLDDNLNGAIARTSRHISHAVLLGVNDAVPATSGPKIAALGLTLNAIGLLLFLSGLGLVLAIGLLVWGLRLRSRLRREHIEIERRDAGVLLLARAIKATENKPWAPELQETLRETVRDDEASDVLRETLRKHKELRLGGIEHGARH